MNFIRKTFSWLFLCFFPAISFGQSTYDYAKWAWETEVRKAVEKQIGVKWNGSHWVVNGPTYILNDILPTPFREQGAYFVEPYLLSIINMGQKRNDVNLLSEAAEIYLAFEPWFATLGELADYGAAFGLSTTTLKGRGPTNSRTLAYTGNGRMEEYTLTMLQFLYPACRLMRIISERPPASRSAAMNEFVAVYTPLLVTEHLVRNLDVIKSKITVNGEQASRSLIGRWEETINGTLPPAQSRMSDTYLWLIASAAEILGAKKNGLIPLDSTIDESVLKAAVLVGAKMFESKRTISFSGGVRCDSYFNGENYVSANDFTTYPDHAYSGYSGETYPTTSDRSNAPQASWDISHFYRVPLFMRALYENKNATGGNFPSDVDINSLVNQFRLKVSQGDMARPLFNNYFDGTNGWYRIGYDARPNFGYPPAQYADKRSSGSDKLSLINSGNLGGYASLSAYDPGMKDLLSRLVDLAASTDSQEVEFRNRYYGTGFVFKRGRHLNVSTMLSTLLGGMEERSLPEQYTTVWGPASITAKENGQTLELSWEEATGIGGADVKGYRVDVSTRADFVPVLAEWNNRWVGLTLTSTVPGLKANTMYYARVRAEDSAGYLSDFSSVGSTRTTDGQRPSITMTAPAANTTYTTPQVATITASASDNVGVTKVWFTRNGVVKSTDTVAPYGYTWSITGADNGAYNWSATAFDAIGNSSTTALVPVTVNIDMVAPTVPELAASGKTGAVVLSWTSSTDAGGSGLAGYRVDLSTDAGFNSYVGGWQGRDVGLAVSTRVAGLAASTLFHARVRAADNAGNLSGHSATASTRTSEATALSTKWSAARGVVNLAGDDRSYRESVDAGGHYVYARSTAGFSTSDLLRFSVRVKPTASPARNVRVSFYNTDVSANRVSAYGTLAGTGSVRPAFSGAATQASVSLTPQPDGWYLFSVAGKLDTTNQPKLTFIISALSGSVESYGGDPAAGFDFKDPEVTVFATDDAPPTIAITAPADHGLHTSAKTVVIETAATDYVGLARVEFYDGGVLKYSTTTFPAVYPWTFSESDNGSHTWTAKAYDGPGNTAMSAAVHVNVMIDTAAPSATVTSPVHGATYTEPQTVAVTALAIDNIGVAKVWFVHNGVVVSTDTASPFEYPWPIAEADNGTHEWTARAFDGSGNETTAATVSVTVDIKGTVEEARAYPVPYRSKSGAPGITFDRLPEGARIRIFTLGGRLVRTLSADGSGRARWGVDNDDGSPVASGVYVVVLEKAGERKTLKIIVQM